MARVLVGPLARLESCGFAGNLNTGMWYVRSTPLAQDMLAFIATIRYTHKADSRVRGWGFNGGTMVRGEAGDVLGAQPADAIDASVSPV